MSERWQNRSSATLRLNLAGWQTARGTQKKVKSGQKVFVKHEDWDCVVKYRDSCSCTTFKTVVTEVTENRPQKTRMRRRISCLRKYVFISTSFWQTMCQITLLLLANYLQMIWCSFAGSKKKLTLSSKQKTRWYFSVLTHLTETT